MITTRRIQQWQGAIDPATPEEALGHLWLPVRFQWTCRVPAFLGKGLASVVPDGILVQGATVPRSTLIRFGISLIAAVVSFPFVPWIAPALALLPILFHRKKIRALRIHFVSIREIRIEPSSVRVWVRLPVGGIWPLRFRATPAVVREFRRRLPDNLPLHDSLSH